MSKPVPAAPLFRWIDASDDITAAEFARKIGESDQNVSNWRRRGYIPHQKVAVVAHAMNLTYEQYLALAFDKPSARTARSRPVASKEGVVSVPVFDIEGSAGYGRVVPAHEPVVGGIQLSREWVRGHLPNMTASNNLAVISAFGDSMSPTFSDGDILLIDRGVIEFRGDAVYVLGRGDELLIKRVQKRFTGEIVIRSDNPLFEPETVRGPEIERVRILGRVLWAWNGRRL